MDDLHAATATTKGSFDRDRPSVGVAELDNLGGTGDKFRGTGNNRCSTAHRCLAARNFVAHLINGFRRWSDELNTHRGDRAREVGVLAEEPVAGMHAVRAALLDGVKDRLGIEVTLCRCLSAEGVGLVGEAHMEGVAV